MLHIEGFIDTYRTKGYHEPSPETLRTYQNSLVQYDRFLDSSGREPDEEAHELFIARIINTKSLGYARVLDAAIRAYHAWAKIPYSTMSIGKTPPKQSFLTKGEVDRLVSACETPTERALMLVLFETGIRSSELLGLRWDQVLWELGCIRVRRKGGREQEVPIYEQSLKALAMLRQEEGGLVFPMNYNRLNYTLKKIGERAHVKCTPHMLRHACASFLRRNGVALDRIAEQLGHTDPKTTFQYYAWISPTDLRDELKGHFAEVSE